MRKLCFLILSLTAFLKVGAQTINFPDGNLKARLLASDTDNQVATNLSGLYFAIDANANGEIEETEAAQVRTLNAKNSGIVDFGGISYFTNMTILDCSWNGTQFEPLTLILDGMPNLKKLFCYENVMASNISSFSNLEELHMGYSTGYLALDLTAFHNLKVLDCSRMYITALNIDGLSNLEELYFSYNPISTINFSSLTHLKTIVGDNTDITLLDLSNLANLESFTFRNTLLVSLNLNGCSSLKEININSSLLTELDVSGLMQLQTLRCHGNLLTDLNLTGCNNLQTVDCSTNHLTMLDAGNLPNLNYLNCGVGSIATLNIANSLKIQTLRCNDNQLTEIDCNALSHLETLYCENNPLLSLYAKNSAIESILNYGMSLTLQYICLDEPQVALYQSQLPNPNCIIDSACTTLKTTSFSKESDVTIYPNPASNNLTIDSAREKVASVQVFNNLGQLVLTASANRNIFEINVALLTVGNYFVKIQTDNNIIVKQFIKN